MENITNLQKKVDFYKEVLNNTKNNRITWQQSLKKELTDLLKIYGDATKLDYKLEFKSTLENLEAVIFSLGAEFSGIEEEVSGEISRPLIKHNGSLIYQQLFNGKIMVAYNLPFIEKYGEQSPLRPIAIYRPEELKEAYILRHLETFVEEVAKWEDYDDDKPEPNQGIGFKMNLGPK
ncbi:MAG: hypothetical protein IPL95_06400 [Saprospiraceae bacterium]|jgi:hypothetical protein|nr:hypothetical protein [Saprospiraceae bacterium]